MESIQILATWTGLDPLILIALILWTMFWKGLALWKSAQLEHKYWFIAILVINTLGLLDIIYIYFVARKYQVEVVEKSE